MDKRMNKEISTEETLRQKDFIKKIRQINDTFYAESGHKKKFKIETFGCQMNARDSEKLIGIMNEMGYEATEDEKVASLIVFNTCCVRENAELKVYGKIGYLKNIKKKNPDLKIALCGCMMQQPTVIETLRKKYRHVDLVFGTHNLYKFAELLYTNIETNDTIFDIWEAHKEIVEDLPSIRKHKFKASVNIMFGCNNFCTYCIVPYVRGRERSRKSEDILDEIKALVADGVKEITLLGQNVNSYGKNLDEEITFAGLIRKINEIEGLKRIRFMTSHPKDLSTELIEAIRDCEKVCNHLHLPVQSGSTKLLEKMNRKYSKEKYLGLIEALRKEVPDISLTTDLIVGFPGETDEDQKETLEVVKAANYTSAFTFIYSKRTGTPAAEMEDQVEEHLVKERFNQLLELLNEMNARQNQEKIGETYEVLVEDASKSNANMVSGRTTSNHLVHLEGGKELIGEIIPVKIVGCKTHYLVGERVDG